MDLLDKVMGEMGSKPGSTAKKPATSASSTPRTNVWGTAKKPSSQQQPPKPLFTTPGSQQGSLGGRIPKREHTDRTGPDPKRKPLGGLSVPDSFNNFGTFRVQMNAWNLDISKMDERISRIMFRATLVHTDGRRFELSLGVSAFSGDVNRQQRRQAQCLLFRAWFKRNPELFKGMTDPAIAAYDAAETIYVGCSFFDVELTEHVCHLTEADFSPQEWKIVSLISRRSGSTFEIRIKTNPPIYTRGPNALTLENRSELTRIIEAITDQCLHNEKFLLYSSGTFPTKGGDIASPDEVTLIKSGFVKTTKIVDRDGVPDAIMTVDTTKSPFYKDTSLLKFFTAKMDQLTNSGGGPRGHNGGRERRDGGGNSRKYDDRRSPRDGEIDYDERTVSHYQRQFQDERISDGMLNTLKQSLKGLDCQPIHLKDSKANRSIMIDEIHTGTADSVTFEQKLPDGEMKLTSITEYYLQRYNYRLKFPHLPLVTSKRAKCYDFYPMELMSILPGQRIKQSHMTVDIQSYMTGKMSSLPDQHIKQSKLVLTEYLKLGDQPANRQMDAFRVSLKSIQPIVTNAHWLSPPDMKFANNQLYSLNPTRGVRFQTNGKFVMPARVKSVTIINYDKEFNRNVDMFAEGLAKHCSEQGMKFDSRPNSWKKVNLGSSDRRGTKVEIEEAIRNGVTIVFGIIAEKRPDMHDILKYFEEKLGQQTIQISSETADKFMRDHGGKQTIDNVIRKLNPKCGGTNFLIDVPESVGHRVVCNNSAEMRAKLYAKTQFIGFEMSHTGARTRFDIQKVMFDGDPTVVGVAYSLKHSAQLGGFSYFQESRLHKLTNLQEKMQICLNAYEQSSSYLPETVVVYRVGSGEGDYPQIVNEVNEMKLAARKKKHGYNPKFLVICTQRNSHIRVFPEHINERGKSMEQNVKSGTCVDVPGASHGYEEFILCCQTPLIGTVKPTKYTIIVNDCRWSKNEIMNVTYHLAFAHQVSYAPPAIPNVSYAAQNLAKRGHNNYKTHTKLVDMNDYSYRIKEKHEEIISSEEVDDILMRDFIETVSNDLNAMTINGRNFWA